jgi:hypothetical protein
MRRLSPQLSYSNVMATVAVFVALGGSAYAATTITGHDIQDGSVSGRDIKPGSLQSSDIKDGTLRRRDFLPGVLPSGLSAPLGQTEGGAGATGPIGPQGERGVAGPAGADGARGPAGADGKDGAKGADGKDGAKGADGKDGAPGAPGRDGTNGTNGHDGTAVAYGTLVGPTVFDAKNIASSNVTYNHGVYCLSGLAFQFKSVIATVYGPGPATPQPGNWDQVATVYYEAGNTFSNQYCPAGTQAMVTVYDIGQALAAGGNAPATFASASIVVWFED